MIKIRHFGFWKKPSHTIFIDKKYYFYAYDAFFFRLASTSFRRVLNIPSPIRYTLPQTPKLPHPSYLKGWGIKIEKTPQLFCTRYARLKLHFCFSRIRASDLLCSDQRIHNSRKTVQRFEHSKRFLLW